MGGCGSLAQLVEHGLGVAQDYVRDAALYKWGVGFTPLALALAQPSSTPGDRVASTRREPRCIGIEMSSIRRVHVRRAT
jgi:hypothetical protein